MEKVCGIYRIVCSNGGYYYGSSDSIWKRWRKHKGDLNRNKHFNPRLQHTWNKYGESEFRIELIQLVPKEQLLEIETRYLVEHVGNPHCFNVSKDATAPNRGLTHIVSEETCKRIGDALRGKSLSEAHKQALRTAAKTRKRSGPPSEEKRRKISESQKGKPRTYLTKDFLVFARHKWAKANPDEYLKALQYGQQRAVISRKENQRLRESKLTPEELALEQLAKQNRVRELAKLRGRIYRAKKAQ